VGIVGVGLGRTIFAALLDVSWQAHVEYIANWGLLRIRKDKTPNAFFIWHLRLL
jgi:hypothetical protein